MQHHVRLFAVALLTVAGVAFGDEAKLRIEVRTNEAKRHIVLALGFDKPALAALQRKANEQSLGEVLTLHAGAEAVPSRPAMLGEVRLVGDSLIFQPRFPLEPGLAYRAVLHLDRLAPAEPSPRAIAKVFSLDRPASEPAIVERVYPSSEAVPENLLKFYLHFSRPMSRGEAYRHIRLLDAAGNVVEDPFLELGEELWNGAGTRFTLFFDPSRIKRGLKPREEVGPVLEEGKSYTLVVSADWPDAAGMPLAREFRKSIRAVAPDDEQPDPQTWRVAPPAAETRQPLEVRFPEPLDHAMLLRVVNIADASGEAVSGEIEISDEETRWRFTPQQPWRTGAYRLVVETALEDRAGNSIRKPFEVDMTQPVEENVKRETTVLPFSVSARPACSLLPDACRIDPNP